MIEFFTLMCQHPGVFFMVIVCTLIFIGMTYDFILKLFKRHGIESQQEDVESTSEDENPYEECYVEDPVDPPPDVEEE